MAKKGEIIPNVVIEHYAAEGKCVTRINDVATFVEGVVPGDVVDLQITRKKKNYHEGRAVRIQTYSDERAQPFCTHFGLCGGCKWQHLDYKKQLKYKQQQVLDQLERIAKIENPRVSDILPSPHAVHYRNKLEFTFSTSKWLTQDQIASGEKFDRRALGFHIPRRFDKIVDIHQCYLQPEPSNAIRNAIRDYCLEQQLSFYDIHQHEGLLRNLIIRTASTGQLMVIVQFGRHEQATIDALMAYIRDKFPSITSLYFVVNTKKNETFFDLEMQLYAGKPTILERLGHIEYAIGPKSFFQTNTSQALVMYQKVTEMARLTGRETVYDLYTGAGTIANFLAEHVERIIGIDNVPEAIEDAKTNAALNNISNATFISGDIKDTFDDDLVNRFGSPNVLIADPPRAGIHPKVMQRIGKMLPDRIVYVSCNPATQARDLETIKEHYVIEEIQPLDMFPHTHHVENIVSLSLKPHHDHQ